MEKTNKKKSCVVLYSGGMDSTVVLHHALKEFEQVRALSFAYGQRHYIELKNASNYVAELILKGEKVIPTTFHTPALGSLLSSSSITNDNLNVPKMADVIGDPQNSTYVPNRNMMFLSIAAAFAESCEADTILYGAALADDTSGFWDCTQEFRGLMNSILSLNRRNTITIQAPLIEMSKKEIIEYGIKLGVDFSKTHTCYVGLDTACGYCPACAARVAGWMQAKIKDPVIYSRDISWAECTSIL